MAFDIGPTRAVRSADLEQPTLGDVWTSSIEDARKVTNQNAAYELFHGGFNEVNEQISRATGKALSNPLGPLETNFGDVFRSLYTRGKDIETLSGVEAWKKEIEGLRVSHPDALDWDEMLATPARKAWSVMKATRENASDVSERRGLADGSQMPGHSIPYVGPFIGAGGALVANMMRDPAAQLTQIAAGLAGSLSSPIDTGVNLISFGAGGRAISIAKNAALNASANMAAQVPLSALKMDDYKAAGLPYGWKVWAEEVAGAGVAGGLLDAGVRAPARAYRVAMGTTERVVRDKSGKLLIEEQGGLFRDGATRDLLPTPPPVREPIAPEVFERARQNDIEAIREIATKSGAIEDPLVKGALDFADMGGKVDADAIERLKAMGVDAGEGIETIVRAIKAAEHLGDYNRTPEPIRQAAEPMQQAEAVRLATEQGAAISRVVAGLPPEIGRIVSAGLEAGLPRMVAAVKDVLATPAARIEDASQQLAQAVDAAAADLGGMDRLQAQVAMHTATDPVQAAAAMRAHPDLVDTNLRLDIDTLRTARALQALDETAWAAVSRGEAPPAFAADVANLAPPGQHAQVLDDLIRANPQSREQAQAMIPELVRRERAPARTAKGIDDPAGPEAEAQTKFLEERHKEAIDEAMAPIKERHKLESKVEDLRGEIAKLEEAAAKDEPTPVSREESYADPESGIDIAPDEVDAIVDMWRYVQETRKAKKPASLTEWLVSTGRVQDQNGELTNILGGKSRYLISGKGRSLDDAAQAAWDRGYFVGERPSVREFLDAIDDDVRGTKRYSESDADAVENAKIAREMETDLDRLGVADAKSEADVRAYFARSSGEGQGSGGKAAQGTRGEVAAEQAARDAEVDQFGLYALADEQPKTPGLDMSPAARKQRAEAMGFDTSRVLYHGTGRDVEAFSLRRAQDREGRQRGLGLGKGKIYLTGAAESAGNWAMQAPVRGLGRSPNVVPVYVRGSLIDETTWGAKFEELSGGRRPYASDLAMAERDAIIAQTDAWAKSQGYNGIQQVYRHHQTGAVMEVGQVAIFDPRNIRSVNAAFDPANAASPNLLYAISDASLSDLAKKRSELADAETGIEAIKARGTPELYALVMEAREVRRERDMLRAIDDALRLASRILPEDTDVRVTDALESEGYRLDAMSDTATGDIALATYAVNPAARLGHEGVHTLVTRGLVSPSEVGLLAKAAREADIDFKEAQYREAYKDRPNLDTLIDEEAAAHYVEAVIAGKITKPDTAIARIVKAIQKAIERVKNALGGAGYKTADDLVTTILNGEAARRAPVQRWMRANDITAMAQRPMAAMSDPGTLPWGGKRWMIEDDPLTGVDSIQRVARSEIGLPTADDLDQAVRRVRNGELQILADAFGGDMEKAKLWKRLWNQAEHYGNGPAAERADAQREALAQEAKPGFLDEDIEIADGPNLQDMATVFRDMEQNPTEIPHILARHIGQLPLGDKNPAGWTLSEAKAVAIMRKAGTEIKAAGLDTADMTKKIVDRYASYFRDPVDAEFMLSTLRSTLAIESDITTKMFAISDRDTGQSMRRDLEAMVQRPMAAMGDLDMSPEARKKRADYTPDQRRSRPPWEDYDVPEDQQIVRFADGKSVSMLAFSEPPPVEGPAMRGLAMFAIKAYHGSPHDFDRFDMSRIGSGEGAQAYGFGLYFAQSRDVADSYRATLSSRNVPSTANKALPNALARNAENFGKLAVSDALLVKGFGALDVKARADVLSVMRSLLNDSEIAGAVVRLVPVDVMDVLVGEQLTTKAIFDNPSMLVDLLPADPNNAVASNIAAVDELAPYVALATAERPLMGANVRSTLQEALTARSAGKGDLRHSGKVPYPYSPSNGRLYEVRINADPSDFLDWDKPLSQQSEKVKGAASKAWGIPVENLHDELFARKVPSGISEKLRDEGVAGVKYLDQGSRTAGEGSRNYVVFRDDLIEIVAKDGAPIEAAERQSVIDGMSGRQDAPDTGKMFAMNDNPPPLHAEMEAIDHLGSLADLAKACRG